MSLDIVNPNPYSAAISDLYVVWNWDSGRLGGDGHLWLQSVALNGTTIWTGNVNVPALAIPFSTPVMLPGDGVKSTLTFTFNYPYVYPGGEELQINFSTPGCEMYPIHVTN